ncbi:MAG: LegC family aminotransferase [Pirellulaceae bacterium]
MPPTFVENTVERVASAIGPTDDFVLLHQPFLPPKAWEYVKDCLDTGWVSSAGAYVTKFEEHLAEYSGTNRAVAVVNGTAALQIALHLAGVQSDDEVIMPSLTFVATANAVRHLNAAPHFVDVCPARLGMSPEALRERLEAVAVRRNGSWFNKDSGARIAAICVMHCFGIPCDMKPLTAIADEYEIPLVEDAAESLGSTYQGVHMGQFGQLSAVSFNGNKIITSGGGGAILTNDERVADVAKHLTTTAKVAHPWEFHHDETGWNYRLPNLNAALGLSQLEIMPELIAAKRELTSQYEAAFSTADEFSLLQCPADSEWNHWLNALILSETMGIEERDLLLAGLNEAKLQSRPLWKPMHLLPMYAKQPRGPLAITESLYARIINIPSSACLAKSWDQ